MLNSKKPVVDGTISNDFINLFNIKNSVATIPFIALEQTVIPFTQISCVKTAI